MDNSPIAALSTPRARGAIALIRTTGKGCLEKMHPALAARKERFTPRKAILTSFLDQNQQGIDEVIVTYYRAPASFTGEDCVEIACHGSLLIAQKILERLFSLGFQPAEAGAFSQRAFLNGKMDLTQAEAIMDIINAQSDLALRSAKSQLDGVLGNALMDLRLALIEASAHLEAYIDFPDESITPHDYRSLSLQLTTLLDQIDRLLATSQRGRLLREGVKTVLAGPPNAGKSTLLNTLLGYQRAIVSPQEGTTRDALEASIDLDGIPLRLVDTAGLRDSNDPVESLGIAKTHQYLKDCDLLLFLADSSLPFPTHILPSHASLLVIGTKNDLPTHPDWINREALLLSAKEHKGIEALSEAITRLLSLEESASQEPSVSISTRHQYHLKEAKKNLLSACNLLDKKDECELIAFELREALHAIGAIIGAVDTEEILGAIFSHFCIGK